MRAFGESEDTLLFRSLLLLFVPAFLGAAVATRAYALPVRDDPERAIDLVLGLPIRPIPPPLPWNRLHVESPADTLPQLLPSAALEEAIRPARRAAPSANDATAAMDIIATAAAGLETLVSPTSDAALDAALRRAGQRDEASLDVSGLTHVGVSRTDVAVGIAQTEGASDGVISANLHVEPGVSHRWLEPDPPPSSSGDPEQVRAALGALRGSIESCASQAGKLDSGMHGRLTLGWRIQDGKANNIEVKSNATGHAELGRCVSRVVQRAHFVVGAPVDVSAYTWIFAPK